MDTHEVLLCTHAFKLAALVHSLRVGSGHDSVCTRNSMPEFVKVQPAQTVYYQINLGVNIPGSEFELEGS